MDHIFAKHSENIPFLIFSEIRKAFVDFCKRSVSKHFKLIKFKEQITDLRTHLASKKLPLSLQKRHQKLLKADLPLEVLQNGNVFVLGTEIARVETQIATVEAELALSYSEFTSFLDKLLELANYSPRPSMGEEWDAFCSLYFNSFINDVKAHFTIEFYSVQALHKKKKHLKELHLNRLNAQGNLPLVLTEELLVKKFKELLVSNKTTKSSNVSTGSTRKRGTGHSPKNANKGKKRAPAKKPGNGSHLQKSSGGANGKKRAGNQANREENTSRPRRS